MSNPRLNLNYQFPTRIVIMIKMNFMFQNSYYFLI